MTSIEQPSATFRPAALLGGSPSPRAGHLPFASDLIAALKPSTIVELGVAYGDTYFGFCQSVVEQNLTCTCYAVDTWRGANSEAYDIVNRYNNSKYSAFSHLIRKTFDNALPQFAAESVSILNLDGNVPLEALKHTFEAWLPKVNRGGVILLNDIFGRGGDAGARRLWDELRSNFPHFSFRNNNGLGVIGKSREDAGRTPFLGALFNAPKEQRNRIRRYYFLCADRLQLAVKVEASGVADAGSSRFQVFRSQGGEYQTAPELSQVVTPGTWINLHLDLPQGAGDRSLRIDATDRPAVVDIAALSLRKANGQPVWTWNPKDVTDQLRVEGTATRMPASEFCRVLSLGAAPQVYLPEFRGAAFHQPLELEIRLRVDLEMSAVYEMNRKWADLEKMNAAGSPQANIEHETRMKQVAADAEARLEAMRVEFETQTARLKMQFEEESRLHQVTVRDRDQLIVQQPRMLQEISIAQGNVEELKAEVERLNTEITQMEYDLVELRKLNARMGAALEQERAARTSMQDSSSWQLTKPFRAVGDLFGPRKKY